MASTYLGWSRRGSIKSGQSRAHENAATRPVQRRNVKRLKWAAADLAPTGWGRRARISLMVPADVGERTRRRVRRKLHASQDCVPGPVFQQKCCEQSWLPWRSKRWVGGLPNAFYHT